MSDKIIIIISIFIVVSFIIKDRIPEVEVETYSVVKNGLCYSYRHGAWVSKSCYKTKEKAENKMNDFVIHYNKTKEHENKVWRDVE